MKNLIFNGSPRKKGGTAALINELSGHLKGDISVISSYHADISPCVDCRYCWTKDKCVINDEMQKVYKLIDEADNIIIASPVYFTELTGSLLNLMSRLQYLWIAREYRHAEALSQKRRNGAIILVDAGEGHSIDAAISMGKRLLRVMSANFICLVHFSGTVNAPKSDIIVPEHVRTEIEALAEKLFFHHTSGSDTLTGDS